MISNLVEFSNDRIDKPDSGGKIKQVQKPIPSSVASTENSETVEEEKPLKPIEKAFKIAQGIDYFQNCRMKNPIK